MSEKDSGEAIAPPHGSKSARGRTCQFFRQVEVFSLGASPAGIAVVGEGHGLGRLHHISGNRAIPAQATEQLRSLSFLVRSDKSVLSGLAGLELERLVLSESRLVLVVQTVVLHLRQLAHDGVDAAVLVVDNIAGVGLHQVSGRAFLLRDGVLDILDRSQLITAALLIGKLHSGELLHHGGLLLGTGPFSRIESLLSIVTQLAYCVVYAMEAISHSAQNISLASLK